MKDAIETHSQTWHIVKATAEKGLETARRKLEQTGSTIEQTEYERGRAKAFREILELAGTQTVIPSVDPHY